MPSVWELLTLRGRLIFLLGIVLSLVTVALGQRPMMAMGIALLLIPLVPVLLMRRSHIDLEIERTATPALTPIGSEVNIHLSITKGNNLSGGVALFQDTVPRPLGTSPRFTLHQFEGQLHRELDYVLMGTKRGRYALGPLLMEMRDPFGKVRVLRGQMDNDTEVFITPSIHTLGSGMGRSAGGTTGEASPQRVSSMGDDDVLVRDYVHGDDMRRVHWRSTAKTGELMVRREEQSLDPSAVVIIDNRSRAHAGSGIDGSFEWAVSVACSIAIHLVENGYRVDLIDANGPVVTSRPGTETTLARQEILEAMTDIDTTTTPSLDTASRHASVIQHGQPVYAVLGSLDADQAEIISRARGSHAAAHAILLDASTFSTRHSAPTSLDDATIMLLDARWMVQPAAKGSVVPELWTSLNRGRG